MARPACALTWGGGGACWGSADCTEPQFCNCYKGAGLAPQGVNPAAGWLCVSHLAFWNQAVHLWDRCHGRSPRVYVASDTQAMPHRHLPKAGKNALSALNTHVYTGPVGEQLPEHGGATVLPDTGGRERAPGGTELGSRRQRALRLGPLSSCDHIGPCPPPSAHPDVEVSLSVGPLDSVPAPAGPLPGSSGVRRRGHPAPTSLSA